MRRFLILTFFLLITSHTASAQTMIRTAYPFIIESDFGIPESYIQHLEKELHQAHRYINHRWTWQLEQPIKVRVFHETWQFTEVTGQPWWIGGYFWNDTIYLQAPNVLQKRGVLRSTVIHEILHVIVHRKIGDAFPLWLHEGMAMITDKPVRSFKRPKNLLTLGQTNYQFLLSDSNADIANAYHSAGYYAKLVYNLKGREGFERLFLILKERQGFENCFEEVFGRSLAEFEQGILDD